jgi:hypothetical protein
MNEIIDKSNNITNVNAKDFLQNILQNIQINDLNNQLNINNNDFDIYFNQSNFNKTLQLIEEFYSDNNISVKDSVVIYIIENIDRQKYVDFFNTLYIPAKQYDILAFNYPEIDSGKTTLKNLYHLLNIENITSCGLWEQGLREIGGKNFQTNTLNGMYFITQLAENQSKYSLSSYSACLQFNDNNDVKYGCISTYIYIDNTFVKKYVYTNDPIYGQVTFETY